VGDFRCWILDVGLSKIYSLKSTLFSQELFYILFSSALSQVMIQRSKRTTQYFCVVKN